MSILVFMNEASANSRTIPMRIFLSDGTSPDTGASNDSVIQITPSGATFVPNAKLAAAHAAHGMYYIVLNQSDVSLCGTNALYHTQGDFCQHVANISVTSFNPFDGARMALSDITLGPRDYGSNTSFGVTTIKAATYSGVTVGSAATILAGTYSGVTVGINNIAAGTYSGVTIGGSSFVTINPGTYSNVTFSAGGTAPSLVTLAPGTHSSATIQGVTTAVNLTTNNDKTGYTIANGTYSAVTFSTGNIAPGTYSGVTVGINNIAAGSYSGVTVGSRATILAGGILTSSFAAAALDATVFATDAEQAFADRLLTRNIAGGADSGRTVSEALFALRNKVDASSSVGTVYQVDDTTSAWTFSNTTGAFPLSSMDPA